MFSIISSLTIDGSGFMGNQIAVKCAMHSYLDRIFDIKPEAIEADEKDVINNINMLDSVDALKEKPENVNLLYRSCCNCQRI
jgi:3-hydroxyacyl-CoA dehydrogenase